MTMLSRLAGVFLGPDRRRRDAFKRIWNKNE